MSAITLDTPAINNRSTSAQLFVSTVPLVTAVFVMKTEK